jgi:DNA-binding CsgD family transcriptional regulator
MGDYAKKEGVGRVRIAHMRESSINLKNRSLHPLGALLQRDTMAAMIQSAIFLGLIWAWYIWIVRAPTTSFSLDAQKAALFYITSLAAPAVVMLVVSRINLTEGNVRMYLVIGAVAAPLCTLLLHAQTTTSAFSESMCLCAGFLGGLVYAILLAGWIRNNLVVDHSLLLITASLASLVMAAGYLLITLLEGQMAKWVPSLFPVLAAFLYPRLHGLVDVKPTLPVTLASPGKRQGFFLASLFLSGGIAKALLNSSYLASQSSAQMACIALASVACIILMGLGYGKAFLDSIFACFIGLTCTLILLSIIFASGIALFSVLVSTCSWFLLVFSICISVYCGATHGKDGYATAFVYLAGIFAAEALIKSSAPMLKANDIAIPTVAVILLALSLVCSIMSRLSSNPVGQREDAVQDDEARVTEIARRYLLTERETEVLALLARRYTMKAIAKNLVISENTVKFHQKNIYRKLGVSSKQEIADLFME